MASAPLLAGSVSRARVTDYHGQTSLALRASFVWAGPFLVEASGMCEVYRAEAADLSAERSAEVEAANADFNPSASTVPGRARLLDAEAFGASFELIPRHGR